MEQRQDLLTLGCQLLLLLHQTLHKTQPLQALGFGLGYLRSSCLSNPAPQLLLSECFGLQLPHLRMHGAHDTR